MRFIADYHTHTAYSGDCETPMETMVQKAIELQLQELVFTDHVDYEYADPNFELIDFDEYCREVSRLKMQYGHLISLLMGVEIGFQPHVVGKINQLLSNWDFEFVICSTHMADRLDFYTGAFFEGRESYAAYHRYFENVLHSVQTMDSFNVYGHLDFIVRYGTYRKKELKYAQHAEIIDEILRQLIYRGKGIEVNTSSYRYGLSHLHPQEAIIKRYRQLGGEIVTVGSDAHHPGDLCSEFPAVYTLLRELGYNYLTMFRNRQPRFVKIP